MPARASDDLPLPEEPSTMTSRGWSWRRTRLSSSIPSRTSFLRPKKIGASVSL